MKLPGLSERDERTKVGPNNLARSSLSSIFMAPLRQRHTNGWAAELSNQGMCRVIYGKTRIDGLSFLQSVCAVRAEESAARHGQALPDCIETASP